MIKHCAKSHEVHYHGAQGGCKGTRAHIILKGALVDPWD